MTKDFVERPPADYVKARQAFIERAAQTLSPEPSKPAEPCLLSRAGELLSLVVDAEVALSSIGAALLGRPMLPHDPGKSDPQNLEGMLTDATVRIACLVGELRTILYRLAS